MVPHEQVQAGGVATANLEAIERRQRLLHGQVTGDRSDGAVAPDQRLDLASGAQTIVSDRPGRVTQLDQFGGDPLLFIRVERKVRIDPLSISAMRPFELIEPGDDAYRQFVTADQRGDAGNPFQQVIASPNCGRRFG